MPESQIPKNVILNLIFDEKYITTWTILFFGNIFITWEYYPEKTWSIQCDPFHQETLLSQLNLFSRLGRP